MTRLARSYRFVLTQLADDRLDIRELLWLAIDRSNSLLLHSFNSNRSK